MYLFIFYDMITLIVVLLQALGRCDVLENIFNLLHIHLHLLDCLCEVLCLLPSLLLGLGPAGVRVGVCRHNLSKVW